MDDAKPILHPFSGKMGAKYKTVRLTAWTVRLTARTVRLTAPDGGAGACRLWPFSLTKPKIMTHLRLQVWGIGPSYTSDWGRIYHLYIRPLPIYPSPKLIYCLYIVHKSVSEVLVSSTLQKYSIYGVYFSLKIVDISHIYPSHQPIYCLSIV